MSTRHDGLLMTTPEQTLHDLRRHPRIASMTSEALYLAADPAGTWRDAPTRSELERRMLRLIEQRRDPAPALPAPRSGATPPTSSGRPRA